MLTFAQSILAARLPWVTAEGTRQRLIRANRQGLIARHSTKDGKPIFAARDIAVFRAIEAVRGDRALRAEGVRSFRDQNGEEVTYRSDRELAAAISALESHIDRSLRGRPSQIRFQTSKGL